LVRTPGVRFFSGVFGERRRALWKKRGYSWQSEMTFLGGGSDWRLEG